MTTVPAVSVAAPAGVPAPIPGGGPLPFMGHMPSDERMDERDVDGAILLLSRFAEDFRIVQYRYSIEINAGGPATAPADADVHPHLRRAASLPLSLRMDRDPLARTDLLIAIGRGGPAESRLTLRHAEGIVHRIRSAADEQERRLVVRGLIRGILDMLHAMRLRRCMDARVLDAHVHRMACVLRSQDPAAATRPDLWYAPFLDLPSRATSYSRQGPMPFHVHGDALRAKAVVDAECGRVFELGHGDREIRGGGFAFVLQPCVRPVPAVDPTEAERVVRDILAVHA